MIGYSLVSHVVRSVLISFRYSPEFPLKAWIEVKVDGLLDQRKLEPMIAGLVADEAESQMMSAMESMQNVRVCSKVNAPFSQLINQPNIQRCIERWTCFAKQQPGRARQTFLAFSDPHAPGIGDEDMLPKEDGVLIPVELFAIGRE